MVKNLHDASLNQIPEKAEVLVPETQNENIKEEEISQNEQ
jgi:hypothetical protein